MVDGLDGQERSPLDEARYKFVRKAWVNNVHMSRTGGISRKVRERQNDIAGRYILNQESAESIAETYERPSSWVKTQLEQGLKRLYDNAPEELRREFAKETLFKTRYQKARETRREKRGTLRSILADPGLSKEQLKELVPRVSGKFYLRNRDLFDPLEEVVREAGCVLPPSGNLSSFAEKLDREGGVVVFSFPTRDERGEVKANYLVLRDDYDASVETLKGF